MGATPIVCMGGEVTSNCDPSYAWLGSGSPRARSHTILNYNIMLQLQAYTSTTTSTGQFIQHETVAEIAGPEAIVSFASIKNLKDLDKKVSIRIQKGNENFFLNCSGPLSDLVRAGKVDIEHILGFHVIQSINEDGEERIFINAPSAPLAGRKVGDTKIKEYTPESLFSPEGFIALG